MVQSGTTDIKSIAPKYLVNLTVRTIKGPPYGIFVKELPSFPGSSAWDFRRPHPNAQICEHDDRPAPPMIFRQPVNQGHAKVRFYKIKMWPKDMKSHSSRNGYTVDLSCHCRQITNMLNDFLGIDKIKEAILKW